MFERARELATQAHAGQMDKAGRPYIEHPERLAAQFQEDLMKTIAILHDVVEDTTVTLPEIERQFGAEVSAEVDALTHRPEESYMEYVRRCALRSRARLIKLADLRDNMDLSRLPEVLAKDASRMERYSEAMRYLLQEEPGQCLR